MSAQTKSSNGFTLIEVLVAIIVLSVGLLGLAGLQVAGMKNNHNAYQRSQATVLAYDIADRMRANQPGVSDDKYDNGTAGEHTACLTTTGCSTSDMAEHDLFEWDTNLANLLPNGQGVVCIDSTPNDGTTASPACDGSGDVYTVKIWWQERSNTDNTTPDLKRLSMSFEP